MAGLEWARVVGMPALHALSLAAVALVLWFWLALGVALTLGRWWRFLRGDFDRDE